MEQPCSKIFKKIMPVKCAKIWPILMQISIGDVVSNGEDKTQFIHEVFSTLCKQ